VHAAVKFEIVHVLRRNTQVNERTHHGIIGFAERSKTGFRNKCLAERIPRAAAADWIAETVDDGIGCSGGLIVKQVQTIRLLESISGSYPHRVEIAFYFVCQSQCRAGVQVAVFAQISRGEFINVHRIGEILVSQIKTEVVVPVRACTGDSLRIDIGVHAIGSHRAVMTIPQSFCNAIRQ